MVGRTPGNARKLTGHVFGRLTVERATPRRVNGYRIVWQCRCVCGKRTFVPTGNLTSGNSRSCGKCIRPRTLDGTIGRVISMRRHTARKRGLAWTVSKAEATRLLKEPCFYCGAPPHHEMRWPSNRGFRYSGLDRVNNRRGYVHGNLRSCCRQCNSAKGAMTEAAFAAWCCRLAKHRWWKGRRI